MTRSRHHGVRLWNSSNVTNGPLGYKQASDISWLLFIGQKQKKKKTLQCLYTVLALQIASVSLKGGLCLMHCYWCLMKYYYCCHFVVVIISFKHSVGTILTVMLWYSSEHHSVSVTLVIDIHRWFPLVLVHLHHPSMLTACLTTPTITRHSFIAISISFSSLSSSFPSLCFALLFVILSVAILLSFHVSLLVVYSRCILFAIIMFSSLVDYVI